MSCDTTTTTEKKIGNVKWFNNKANGTNWRMFRSVDLDNIRIDT